MLFQRTVHRTSLTLSQTLILFKNGLRVSVAVDASLKRGRTLQTRRRRLWQIRRLVSKFLNFQTVPSDFDRVKCCLGASDTIDSISWLFNLVGGDAQL